MSTFNLKRPLAVGIYNASQSFRSQPRHVSVMFEDDQTLVACTGYADYSDKKAIDESFAYAQLFKTAPDMLKLLEEFDSVFCNVLTNRAYSKADKTLAQRMHDAARNMIIRAKTVGSR